MPSIEQRFDAAVEKLRQKIVGGKNTDLLEEVESLALKPELDYEALKAHYHITWGLSEAVSIRLAQRRIQPDSLTRLPSVQRAREFLTAKGMHANGIPSIVSVLQKITGIE